MEKPFASLFGATSLSVITDFSPDESVRLPLEELTQFIIDNGENRFKDQKKVVETLQRATRESYQLRSALTYSIDLILATILQTLRALQEALEEVDRAIEKEFRAFPNTLQSIKGIGPVYRADIFSEIGEISRFRREDTLAKFTGLTWKRYQSGNLRQKRPE